MFERFFSGSKLMTYLHVRDEYLIPITIGLISLILAVFLLLGFKWIVEVRGEYRFVGFEEAVVLKSTIGESEHQNSMYMHLKTISGEEFWLTSTNTILYATEGAKVCVKLRERPSNKHRVAGLVGQQNCAELPVLD